MLRRPKPPKPPLLTVQARLTTRGRSATTLGSVGGGVSPPLSALAQSVGRGVSNTWVIPAVSSPLASPTYAEGYGKLATGGLGQSVYTVTSSAATGAGTFDNAFQTGIGGNAGTRNLIIQFAVSSFTTSQRHVVGSNVTIDGTLNGQNGVTYIHNVPGTRNGLLLVDGESNIIIRGLNFQSTGAPNSENTDPTTVMAEENFIWLAGGATGSNGGVISTVLIDRCTFFQATNKAIDITNGDNFTSTTEYVTVQRCLFHDNALTSHIKYADGGTTIRRNISYHHNAFVHGGERQPQLVDAIGPFDYVNNVLYTATSPDYYQHQYPDGSTVDPYNVRLWCTSAAGQTLRFGAQQDSFHGDIIANIEANVVLGDLSGVLILADTLIPSDPSPASVASIYISSDNVFSGGVQLLELVGGTTSGASSSNPSLPWHTQNAIPGTYRVSSRLLRNQMVAQMLPYIGAPNRTALDTQRLNELSAQL